MAPSSMARVAGRGGPEAPINLVQLATNTLGNRDLEVQVLHLFKSQSSTTLERLACENDAGVRLDLVHTLKGSARAIGAERVAMVCENLEVRMQSTSDTATEGLIAAVDEANRYIRDLLEG
ncbi:Hpt domain-containing protein [Roseibium salinum]|uniref:Hpt domain-containing protein n=1 Tax=Roseibium salinum TaxID=1604349 RepID=A0ABT3QYV4_9HYPH|nr:Hpt domain-containing protein [Roseibium sp. DSM 29163]MCX2722026.1 Hpt domain-containing protein [Roseibium sp. DSM 29163]MDN3719955.1 Hpt domain-containing protein [Roseibium salinum]